MTVAAASRATAAKAQIIKRFMGTSVPLPIVLSVEPLQGSTAVPANMDRVETLGPNEFYSLLRPALGTPEAEERPMKCSVCEDCGWVCENHPYLPWQGEHAFKAGRAGGAALGLLRKKGEQTGRPRARQLGEPAGAAAPP